MTRSRPRPRSLLRGTLAVCLCLILADAKAGSTEQARRIHDRLTGVPPTAETLAGMTAQIDAGDATAAAFIALTNPAFYNTTVREFATPFSNRDRSIYTDLNDTTATIVGMVRDAVPFDRVLFEDIVYIGSNAATNVAFAANDNAHYLDLQSEGVDLSDPGMLVQSTQSALTDLDAAATAGVMTSRGFSEAFLVAGTNRAAVRFAMLNFMCLDQEDLRDVTAWPDRIRQDVTRSPGGDSAIFLNDCLACHAGLDGLAGAFAYYDFDPDLTQLVYTNGNVQPKYLRDAGVFRNGFRTLGDSWVNYWRTGPNSHIGWSGMGSGTGAKSLGQELAQTRRFAECQVQRVFEKVCHRTPNGTADVNAVQTIANAFEADNRNMQTAFAHVAVHCMGD
ncbi:MAG: hypothetical protein AAF515_06625 [Pseudomonadota bacterium]